MRMEESGKHTLTMDLETAALTWKLEVQGLTLDFFLW